jgi:hypothetical protein
LNRVKEMMNPWLASFVCQRFACIIILSLSLSLPPCLPTPFLLSYFSPRTCLRTSWLLQYTIPANVLQVLFSQRVRSECF